MGDCPVCGKPVREKGRVYACDTDRACSFVIFKSVAKRDVSRRSATQLIKSGRTPVLKGFKSRQGKPFDAALVLKEDGTVGFEFPPRDWEKGPPREGPPREGEKAAPAPKAALPAAPRRSHWTTLSSMRPGPHPAGAPRIRVQPLATGLRLATALAG